MNLYHNAKNNTFKIEIPTELIHHFLEAINAHINFMVERLLEEYPTFTISTDIQSSIEKCEEEEIKEDLETILPFEILAKKLQFALDNLP